MPAVTAFERFWSFDDRGSFEKYIKVLYDAGSQHYVIIPANRAGSAHMNRPVIFEYYLKPDSLRAVIVMRAVSLQLVRSMNRVLLFRLLFIVLLEWKFLPFYFRVVFQMFSCASFNRSEQCGNWLHSPGSLAIAYFKCGLLHTCFIQSYIGIKKSGKCLALNHCSVLFAFT